MVLSRSISLYVLLFALLCWLFPLFAHGQLTFDGFQAGDSVMLDASADYPQPGQSFTVTAQSNQINLDEASIAWTIDGTELQEARDSKSIQVTAGKAGKVLTISVAATTPEGGVYRKTLRTIPASVDIIWETSSRVPPFYKGKTLAAAGNAITLIALPNLVTAGGSKLKPSELIYTWKQGSQVLGSQSGLGAQKITIAGPEIFKNIEIIVEVTNVDKSLGAAGFIDIDAAQPRVLFYEKHPTLGVKYEHALSSEEVTSGEISVVAEPYFISMTSTDIPNLRFKWRLNGESIENPSLDQTNILLRPTGAGGQAHIDLTVEHTVKHFQQARGEFDISFSQ